MILFDAVKQLELDVFSDLMFGMANDGRTSEEFKESLQSDYTEEALQRFNEAALQVGHHPLSFTG